MRTSERSAARRRMLVGVALPGALVLLAAGTAAAATELRLGGSLGMDVTAEQQPGGFGWDFDAAGHDTALAVLQAGGRLGPGVEAFFDLGAAHDGSDRPRFELREAALQWGWRRASQDSLRLRLFARQPSCFWLDLPLRQAVSPAAAGGEDALGARADLRWGGLAAALVAADRGGVSSDLAAEDVETPHAQGGVFVARLRGDLWRAAGMRVGATWKRLVPTADVSSTDPATSEARRRDVFGFDLRSAVQGWTASLEYTEAHAVFTSPAAERAQEPGLRTAWRWRRSRRLTDILPGDAALRAELRAARLGTARWGWVGLAPAYRALGAQHTDRLGGPEPDIGSPRRGLEGYRLEAWYEVPGWPAWVRQTYDRSAQFRDAERSVLLQATQVQASLSERVRAAASYVQRRVRDAGAPGPERHDDALAELAADDSRSRMRLQIGILDLNSPQERSVLVLEASAVIAGNLKALARATSTARGAELGRSLFVELQYWHLPEFEAALQVGPEWIGAAADPVLDAGLATSAVQRDIVRLHFRGWF